MSTSNVNNEYGILPAIDIANYPMSSVEFKFWAKNVSGTINNFYVGVMTDSTQASTFVPIDTIVLTTSMTEYTVTFDNYTGSGRFIALKANRVGNGVISVDDISIIQQANCAAPTDVVVSDITYNSAQVSWTAGASSSWVVYCTLGTTTETLYCDNPSATLASLLPNTTYSVSVAADCGNGTYSNATTPVSFKTACAPVTASELPYMYGFEDATTTGSNGQISSCWTRHVTGGSTTNYPYPYSSQKHSGNYSLYFYNTAISASTRVTSWATLPMFESQLNTLQLSFWGYKSSSNYGHLKVGVMSDPDDFSTFVNLADVQVSAVSTWEYFEVPLSSYTGSNGYLALVSNDDVLNNIYVDDITVDVLPACPRPTTLGVDNFAEHSCTLDWTENGTATEWLVQYTSTNFTTGDVTTLHAIYHPFILSGLSASTAYQIRVASLCNNGDTSSFSYIMGRTLCGEVDLPFYYDFESDGSGTGTFPYCWTRFNDASGTGTIASYPYISSSSGTAHGGNNYLYFYPSTNASYADNVYAILPAISTTDHPMSGNELLFWAKLGSAGAEYPLVIGVISDPDTVSGFVPVDTVVLSSNVYNQFTVSLAGYTGPGKHIAFYSQRPPNASSHNLYIDDIEIRRASSCPTPENVRVVSTSDDHVTVAWSGATDHSGFTVYYGPAGFSENDALTDFVIDTTCTLVGLQPSTDYEFYVVASCSIVEAYATPRYSFTTECAPIDSLPYIEDFESYSTGSSATIDPCWHKGTNYSTAYPYPYATAAIHGAVGLYFYGNSSSSVYSYATLPRFQADLNTLRLRFNMKRHTSSSDSYHSHLIVGVMSDPYDIGTFDTVADLEYTDQPAGSVHPIEVSFESYAGNGQYIALFAPAIVASSSHYNYIYVDDVEVDLLPNCRNVSNLTASDVTWNGATLTWSSAGETATAYKVAYSTQEDFDPDTCSNAVVVSDTTYQISGLNSFSTYYWAVATICGGDTAEWATKASFATLFYCGDNFDNIVDTIGFGTSSTSSYTMCCNVNYPIGYSTNIFTVAELSAMGIHDNNLINSISIHSGTTGAIINNVDVYMTETDMDAFSSTPANDTIAVCNMTHVYHGTINFTSGTWTEIVFDSAFHYDGQHNLMVTLRRGVTSAAASFYYTSTSPDYRTCYGYRTATGTTLSANRVANRTNMIFNICSEIPACERPSDVALTSLMPTSAQVSWTGSAANYEVAYGPEGFDLATAGTHAFTTGSSYTLTGLTPQTAYDFYVRGICNTVDTSSWIPTFAINTPCSAVSLPYTEDFEAYASGSNNLINPCWTKGTNSTTAYPYPYSTNAVTGNLSLYFYAYRPSSTTSTPTYSYAALPAMDAPIDSLMLTFSMRRYSSSSETYTTRMVVGVMIDPNDINTFQPVDTIDMRNESPLAVRRCEVAFNNYTGNGQFIALYDEVPPLYGSSSTAYSYAYVDDILVDYIPSCPSPDNVTVSNITPNGATVSWTDRISTPMGWELEYGPAGFVLGNGTRISPSTTSATITGLNSATYYDVYVRDICSATDSGAWSMATTFITDCGVITNMPYVNGFEMEQAGGQSITSYPSFATCWTRFNNSTSASYQGLPYVTTTETYVHSGTKALYFYAGANSSSTAYPFIQMAVMPQVDNTLFPTNTLQVNFFAKGNSSYLNNLYVGVMTDPTNEATFVTIDSIALTGTYDYYEVPLTSYTGTGAYVAFRVNRAATAVYAYLDDVELDIASNCPRPENLVADSSNSNSVRLSWDETGSSTQWVVEYGSEGFLPGHGTAVVANSNPFRLTGLNPNTRYQAYVRAICTIDDTSRYCRVPVVFTTSQTPAAMPYTYDFENAAEWANWQTSSNQNIGWVRGNAVAGQGSYSMYVSPDNGATCGTNLSQIVNAVAYRDIDFGNTPNTFAVDFRVNCGGSTDGNYDGVSVLLVDPATPVESYSTALTTPWGHVNDVSLGTVRRDTTWADHTVYLENATGVRRLVFYWFNQSTGATHPFMGGPAAIDSISVYQLGCDRPYALEATNVAQHSATFTWSGEAGATYVVAYRMANTSTGTVYDTTNNLFYNVSGLNANTSYNFWVRKICDSENVSPFSSNCSFTTECDLYVATDTFYEDFHTTPGTGFSDLGVLPSCWEGYSNGTNPGYMPHVVNTGTSYWYTASDSNSIIMTSGSEIYGNTKVVCLPRFLEPVSNLTLSYWMCTESSTNGVLSVGYMTGDNYETDFVPVKSIPASSATIHNSIGLQPTHGLYDTISFDSVPANADRIAFMWTYSTSFYSCCIDNVKVTSQGCTAPVVTDETHTTDAVTIGWVGTGDTYLVNIKESLASEWPDDDTVSATTYTFNGLHSATSYQIRLRQYCSVAEEWSDWTYYNVTTDSLLCYAPDNLQLTALTNSEASFDWTPNGAESNWDLHVWFAGGLDTICRVSSHPATISGLTAGVTYNAAVRALCGPALEEGNWSDVISFTTPTCPDVTGLAAGEVTTNSVTLSWDADTMVQNWIVEYGYAGFTQGQGTSLTVNSNTCVVTDLSAETPYDFYVQAVCGSDWYSEQWAEISATTLSGSGDECDPVTNLAVSDITTNSAMVTWFSESGSAWNVVVPEANVDVTVTEQQYALTGLLANTNYNVKVRTVCDNDQYSDFVTTSFMTEQEEGIDGVETMSCTIYPNPTSSATTISVSGVNGKVKIAIVDMNGRTVASETMECASDCVKTMDVENLAQGAYFVRITGESVNMVKKLVVR